jgi:heat shock protein HslJ
MAQVPGRIRGSVTILAVSLAIAAILVACGSSATPSPSGGGGGASAAAGGVAALNGKWTLTNYTSPGGTEQAVPAAITPSLELDGDAARGYAGCNTFTAIVVADPKTIHFDQVAATKVACPEPGPTIEAAFLQALNLATQWNVTGDTLTLNAPGSQPTSLKFLRAPA